LKTSSFRQYAALGFCAFTVPAILFLPQCGWVWAGLTALVTAILCLGGTVELPNRPLSALLLLWNCLILGFFARQLSLEAESHLPGLLLLLLAAYAAGEHTLPRVAGVVFFFLTLMYGALLLFALPKQEFSALAPKITCPWELLPYGLAPTAVLYLSRERGKPTLWLAGGIVLAVLAAVVTQGMRAPDFYTAAKSVSLLGTMERLEPLVLSALTAGGFCLMGLLCTLNQKIGKLRSGSAVNFVGGFAGYLLVPMVSGAWLALGTAIFWGLLPFGLQFVGFLKNFKKK
jgi:hypothetical protein